MAVTRRKNMCRPQRNAPESRRREEPPKRFKDLPGILLLIGLYILQGIPLGLASAVPFLLHSDQHTASYQLQAIFSWVFWPFSLKLAWAPIVDALYLPRLGRRKTWLLPVQYALGVDLFVLGGRVDHWLGRHEGERWGPLGVARAVQIWPLTAAFFGLTLLAATQDIVVDGWALTMLSPENVGWASTCNSVGQTIGYIFGFIVFLALESPDVCNNYLRIVPVPGEGLVSFSGFLYLCGGVFIVSTSLVALFKRENEVARPEEAIAHSQPPQETGEDSVSSGVDSDMRSPLIPSENGEWEILPPTVEAKRTGKSTCLSLWQTYRTMLGILRLKPLLCYIAFIFIIKFVFSACDSVFGLKLLEHGVSKERMALIGSAVLPLQALLPVLVTRWSNGPRPLGVYLNAAIPRLLVSLTAVLIVYYVDFFRISPIAVPNEVNGANTTSTTAAAAASFSTGFYILLICHLVVYAVFSHTMFVCQMAFHARVSDPAIGGTYMTLLNTAANLAAALPSTLMLFLVEPLTWRSCENASLEKAALAVRGTDNRTAHLHAEKEGLSRLAEQFLASNATCKGHAGVEACQLAGGACRTVVDGFYIEVGICSLVGLLAYFTLLRQMASRLDNSPLLAYRLGWRSPISGAAATNPHG